MHQEKLIGRYMTEMPHTIGEDIILPKAIEMMKEFRIRHLPVQYNGKVTGMLSERDIQLVLSIHPTAKDLKVGDVMTDSPYCVESSAPLAEVVTEMARRKYGAAIIENESGRAIGIFTAIDALSLLGEFLSKR